MKRLRGYRELKKKNGRKITFMHEQCIWDEGCSLDGVLPHNTCKGRWILARPKAMGRAVSGKPEVEVRWKGRTEGTPLFVLGGQSCGEVMRERQALIRNKSVGRVVRNGQWLGGCPRISAPTQRTKGLHPLYCHFKDHQPLYEERPERAP